MFCRGLKYFICLLFVSTLTVSCSIYKNVPQDSYLLDKISVSVEKDPETGSTISKNNIKQYIYQHPNTKWLGFWRAPVRLYSMFGGEKKKARKKKEGGQAVFNTMGQAPVIYNERMTDISCLDITKALVENGFLHGSVSSELSYYKKPRVKVTYNVTLNQRYSIESLERVVRDSTIEDIILADSVNSLLFVNGPFSIRQLDSERARITDVMHQKGYYHFNKDHIWFVADTLENSTKVGLTMYVDRYFNEETGQEEPHSVFSIGKIDYIFTENAGFSDDYRDTLKSQDFDNYSVYFKKKRILRPTIIDKHSILRTGMIYNADSLESTRSSLAKLSILKYTHYNLVENNQDKTLDTRVYLVTNKSNSVKLQVEGTNTAGDLGAAALLSWSNRNMFGGSELFTVTFRGAFEAINNLPGYSNVNSYLENGIEAKLEIPQLVIPFVSDQFHRNSVTTTRFDLQVNLQKRPEFNKRVYSGGWSYSWNQKNGQKHNVDLLGINFLTVPWISETFKNEYLDPIKNANSIVRYNYEDLFIVNWGYSFFYDSSWDNNYRWFQYYFRISAETAGNLLQAGCKLAHASKNSSGQYELGNIAFAQYVKHDFQFVGNWKLTSRQNLLFDFSYGIALPYGNSSSLPFEKRYFAGGANSVRGWQVRELGPGQFSSTDRQIDYIKQSGDIKLFASLEYRANIFWKLNGALFVDAGNIWTIKSYDEQPGGEFSFNRFYKQIAVSYGLGLRLDLNFLVLRVDAAMKALNPIYDSGSDRYPIMNPKFKRDFAYHIAVGYPF